ncbi:MAG: hypothetical protein ACM3JP_02170 [Betaproteobacteria bacterium]
MDGQVSQRRWWAGLAVSLVAAMALALTGPAPAAAADDPPNIDGLTVDQATTALQNWNKSVVITFVPALDKVPPSLGPDAVLVYASHLIPQTFRPAFVPPPQVEVDLGTPLPDLTGRTPSAVDSLLAPVEMTANPLPVGFQPDWVVRNQRPEAGTIMPFGSRITVVLVAPTAPSVTATPLIPPSPPPRRRISPALVAAVGGGSLALLALAALLTTSSLRRRRRRLGPLQRVEARPHAGPVIGPHLYSPMPGLSVRLEARSNPGPVVFHEEVPR